MTTRSWIRRLFDRKPRTLRDYSPDRADCLRGWSPRCRQVTSSILKESWRDWARQGGLS
jgi:hypothetical protein